MTTLLARPSTPRKRKPSRPAMDIFPEHEMLVNSLHTGILWGPTVPKSSMVDLCFPTMPWSFWSL